MNPLGVNWSVDTTSRCTRRCKYCLANAGLNGVHLDTGKFVRFCDDMVRAQAERHIAVGCIGLTGDGEGLENPDLPIIAKAARNVSPALQLMTSGAWNSEEERRLEAVVALSEDEYCVRLSFDPENPESVDRLERTLLCKLSPSMVVLGKMWPDIPAEKIHEHEQVILKAFERSHCHPHFTYVLEFSPTGVKHNKVLTGVTTKHGTWVTNQLDWISPSGRARNRLSKPMYKVPPNAHCAGFDNEDGNIRIHTRVDSTLTWCCEARKATGIPATYNGLFRLLSERYAIVTQVNAAIASAAGKTLFMPCDVCPLY